MQGDAGNPFARPALHLAIGMQRLFAEPIGGESGR
jgi:hypothetical protein